MKIFEYVVSTQKGARKKGKLRAPNKDLANKELSEQGYIIVSLTENEQINEFFWQKPHLSFEARMMFTKHLATMIRVGITIAEALQILQEQTNGKNNKRMFENLVRMVSSGQTLSKSLAEYPSVFSAVFISMIATGEESGTLEKVLEYLDAQIEKEYELRKRIVSAFVYPVLIVGITLILTGGIIFFLMPKITSIFESFDVQLPLPTRILIGISTFSKDHPVITFGGMFIAFVTIVSLLRWRKLRPFWHRVILRIPVFGKLMRNVSLARFSRTMNSLIMAGVPITRALDITKDAISNTVFKNKIALSHDKVEQGAPLGESFEGDKRLFPPLMTKMFMIGEKTGSLEESMAHLARLYERNVDSMTRNLTVLLEPLLLVFMGLLVGGVAISIILPIYQIPSLISK